MGIRNQEFFCVSTPGVNSSRTGSHQPEPTVPGTVPCVPGNWGRSSKRRFLLPVYLRLGTLISATR